MFRLPEGVCALKLNFRLIIFVLVVLAVGVIFVTPYLTPVKPEITKFTVTPDPVKKLTQAAADGKPVFLEFYSPQ